MFAGRVSKPGKIDLVEVPEPKLLALLAESELIAMVNWTMLSQLTGIIRNLLTRILPDGTAEQFARDYSVPIRIRVERVRGH